MNGGSPESVRWSGKRAARKFALRSGRGRLGFEQTMGQPAPSRRPGARPLSARPLSAPPVEDRHCASHSAERDRQMSRSCASCAQPSPLARGELGVKRPAPIWGRMSPLRPSSTGLGQGMHGAHRPSRHPRAMPGGDDGRRAACPCQACTGRQHRSRRDFRASVFEGPGSVRGANFGPCLREWC